MPKGICYNANRQERRKCSLWHAKSPGVATSGAFLFRCGKVAYALGWLPPIYLRPAICRCSRRLHLPRQRVRKTKIYSWWHTPFLYLYRGGSIEKYTMCTNKCQNENTKSKLKAKKDLPLSDKSFIINLKLLLWCANTERLYRFSNNQLSTNALIFVLQV